MRQSFAVLSGSCSLGFFFAGLCVLAQAAGPNREALVVEDDGCACGQADCEGCGQDDCGACRAGCPVGPAGRWWARGEYLGWGIQGMHVPALVTQAPRGSKGVLFQTGTEVVYGDDRILEEFRSGFRVQLGTWLDRCHLNALEGEYFKLGDASERFCDFSSGNPTVARPFFNALNNQQDSELVGFLPSVGTVLAGSGALSGGIVIDSRSSFQGAGLHLLTTLCCAPGDCGRSDRRVSFLVGYRYLGLDEGLSIRENLYSLDPTQSTDPTRGNAAFIVRDQFDTSNAFNGADLGLVWTCQRDRWSLGLLTKLGLGANRQRVRINGSTTQTDTATGTSRTSTVSVPSDGEGGTYTGGGLLAQRSNIGVHDRDIFALVPELGVTLGYQVNCHWKATAGYTLMAWTNVVRPGDQIDTSLNPQLLPDEQTLTGPLRPSFAFHNSTLLAQGLNLGLEYTW
jgi:hypothetical protein